MPRRDRLQMISALQSALTSDKIPDTLSRTAERVLHYLQKKPRVSLLWYSAYDAEPVVNKLLGDGVMGEGLTLPPTRFRHGAEEKIQIQLPDGSKATFPGTDPMEVLAHQPVFLTIFTPAAGLRDFDLMLLNVPRDVATASRAVTWAAGETDIAIWCTEEYGPDEEQICAHIPEHMQDHSFLAFLPRSGQHSPNYTKAAADPDRLFYTVAKIDYGFDNTVLNGELFTILARQLEAAQSAILDQAEVTISSLEKLGIGRRASAEEPGPTTGPRTTKTIQKVLSVVTDPEVDDLTPTNDTSEPEQSKPRSEPEPQAPEDTATDTPVQEETAPETVEEPVVAPALDSQDVENLRACVSRIESFSRGVCAQLQNGESPDDLLIEISDIILNLNDVANDMVSDGPIKSRLINASGEAADLTQLLQVENSADATLEAVDLLHQAKFELELWLSAA